MSSRAMRSSTIAATAAVLSSLALMIAAPSVLADVKLPAVIGNGMVLQRHQRVPIYGWADAGERVTVKFRNQQVSTTTGQEGTWVLRLTALSTGGPDEMTVSGKNSITLTNILVGEVWACSGQSNMQWPVRASINADQEVAAAKYPTIRLFTVARRPSAKRETDVQGSWTECSPETVPGFTAVGYFFGRKLHQDLGIPIGLINASWGGTMCEAWTSREMLEQLPEFQSILDRWTQAEQNYPEQKKKHEEQLAKWTEDVEKAKAEGKPQPRRPYPPRFEQKQHQPAGLFNGMIAPLLPYAIRGAIWYQGESNAGRAYQYRELFPTMIRDWRLNWGQGAFPFLFVQLANFQAKTPDPGDSAWAELREAQLMTLALRNTGQGVIIDIGEAADIHPKNKQDVGKRLALIALANTYGQDVEYYGPAYESMSIERDRIRLEFSHADGMVAKGGGPLTGFAIAGEDKQFVWAEATIEGDTVVVQSDKAAKPVAVRYGWANNPDCNLYNSADLPASPFRTDDWPGVTFDKR